MDIYEYFFTFWFSSAYLVLLREPLLLICQITSRPRVSCTIFWKRLISFLIIWSEQPEHSSVWLVVWSSIYRIYRLLNNSQHQYACYRKHLTDTYHWLQGLVNYYYRQWWLRIAPFEALRVCNNFYIVTKFAVINGQTCWFKARPKMSVTRTHFENNNEVGVFSKLTNAYCLVAIGGSENFYSAFQVHTYALQRPNIYL